MGRRKTIRKQLVEELFRALFEEARKNPDGVVGRWLGRVMLAVIVGTILILIVVFWGAVTVGIGEIVVPLLSSKP